MTITDWLTAFGGLGLLLLGMGLMTDGLKAAAGDRLQGFLETGTATRVRAALSGFVITALVQSSSAVVVALLGFTNAGMMKLRQAAWVVFGSNLGTTMTAWLVVLVGLKFDIGMLAWPLIGTGMLLKVIRNDHRLADVGTALTGFGVLFVGIDVLSSSFDQLVTLLPVTQLQLTGPLGLLLALLGGALLTALVQSSSAAMAIVLTASVSGVFSPLAGAAVVIGTNVGTTVTALLATINATPNAKRLALIHVLMNLVTASIALVLLAPLWWIANWLSGVDGVADLSTGLAAFHTVFNLLGLLLMVIVGERIISRAEAVYKMPLLRSGEPRYLDNTVLQVPSMGLNALHQEQKRVFKQYLLRLRGLLEPGTASDDGDTNVATGQLLAHISDFAQRINQQSLHGHEALALADLHGVRYRLYDLRQLVEYLERIPLSRHQQTLGPEASQALLSQVTVAVLRTMSAAQRLAALQQLHQARENLRKRVMQQVNDGQLSPSDATDQLQLVSSWWRSAELVTACANVMYPVVD
jgi:phosphate:Na+ symporter